MKAVVMAGGEGSRLRPLTSQRPKPLVPVAGRSIMEHILLLLRGHQMREVVATIQYLGANIRNHFGDGSELGIDLSYSVEDTPLGTAGSVKLAQEQLKDTFVVISGDALTDIDLSAAVRFHQQRKAMVTIVLKPVPTPLEYGVVVADEDGRVRRFLEKPGWGEVISDLANTGIYVLEPEVFDYFQGAQVADWSGDVFPLLLKERQAVFGWVAEGYWEDVGSHSAYLKANFDCLEGRVKIDLPGREVSPGVWVAEDAEVAEEARIDGPALIGAGARIRPGAWINGPVVIGSHATVDTGAKVSNSILWDHAYIGQRSRLRGAVVCRAVTLKADTLVEEGAVVGDEVVVGAGAQIKAGVRIWPNKEVEPGADVTQSVIWAGSWKRGLFTSVGLTGLVNIEFTPEFAARLGAAVGALYPKGAPISISRDHSRPARMIHRALAAGLTSSGANIADMSALSVPAARHWAHRRRQPGVHVQNSPVDSRSVDIRIFDTTGLDLDKGSERKLENLFFREDIRRVAHYEMGSIDRIGSEPGLYIDDLLQQLDVESIRAAHLKLLIDYSNGATSLFLPQVLQELGATVIPLNASVRELNPERDQADFEEHLKEIGVIAKAVSADFGVFIDSPGERCFLVDHFGTVLGHDQAFAVLAELALSRKSGVLLGPTSGSLLFSIIAERNGGRFVATKVTPGAVLRGAQRADVVLASDAAGGYCWPEFLLGFDAAYTTVKLMEMLAVTGRSLADVRSTLPTVGYSRRIEFCPWDSKGRVMRMVMERHLDDRVDLTDGVKVFVDGGWVLVVPDTDRPEYQVIAATTEVSAADPLATQFANQVREIVVELAPSSEGVIERD